MADLAHTNTSSSSKKSKTSPKISWKSSRATETSTTNSDLAHSSIKAHSPDDSINRPKPPPSWRSFLSRTVRENVQTAVNQNMGPERLHELDYIAEQERLRQAERIAPAVAEWQPLYTQNRIDFFTRHAVTFSLFRRFLGEFIGCLFLSGFGAMGCIMYPESTPIIGLAWGAGVWLGQFVSDKHSGAHLNPGITLGLVLFRDCSWVEGFVALIGQFFGHQVAWAYAVFTNGPLFDAAVAEGGIKAGIRLIAGYPDRISVSLVVRECVHTFVIVFTICWTIAKNRGVTWQQRYTIIAGVVAAAIVFSPTPVSLNGMVELTRRNAAFMKFGSEAWSNYFVVGFIVPTLMHVVAFVVFDVVFCDPQAEVLEGYAQIRGPQTVSQRLRRRAPRVFRRWDQVCGFFPGASTNSVELHPDLEVGGTTRGEGDAETESYTEDISLSDLTHRGSALPDQSQHD